MAKEPLCRACDSKGLTVLAKELDHIRPLNEGGERLDPANVQPLCKDCHTLKTAKVRIGSPTYKGNWPA
jgi:5-methylcytosine-specific restriction endonuclease McrA